MRNIIIFTLAMLSFAILANAQPSSQAVTTDGSTEASGQNEAGFKIGINFTNVRTGISYEGYKVQTGITVGVFIVYKINEILAIQNELCFSWKNAKADKVTFGSYQIGPIKGSVFYLELPVLIRISVPMHSIIVPSIYLGPVFDYNIDGSYEYGGATKTIEDLNEFGIGLVLGGSTQVHLGAGSLILYLRYNYGLLPIYENDFNSDWDTYSDVFSIGLGYAY